MNRVGKYEIRDKLGEGATATVYLGFDPFAKREVAIKLIQQEALQDRDKGRMYRHLLVNEASLAGKLMHPHIVQIYDAVLGDDLSYIVMEYVAGGTLEQFCAPDRLLPLERLVEVVFKCTRALEYANRLGVTHRDIKPANILLAHAGQTGDIKISDFGAAQLSMSGQTRTQVMGVGSPAYMSPEQVQDQALNHQTDIYSLGVVMYQLLTGRLPFTASNNYSMLYQITQTEALPPSTLRAEIPPAIDAIVARAMCKDRAARYAEWGEFSRDLFQAFRNQQLAVEEREVPDSERFETLRGMDFFREFSDVEIWEVVRFSSWDDFAPQTAIMKDGDAGDFFCFVVQGEVVVSKRGTALGVLKSGECFGEMALIATSGRTRGADVLTQARSRVITIRADALRHASEACRMHFYEAFLDVLSRRLTLANDRLASL